MHTYLYAPEIGGDKQLGTGCPYDNKKLDRKHQEDQTWVLATTVSLAPATGAQETSVE